MHGFISYAFISHTDNRTTVGLECHDIYIVHKENFNCCGADYQHFPLSVNVYCDGVCNVSVGVQWFDHIAVDLDFPQTTQIQQNTVYVSYIPVLIGMIIAPRSLYRN